MSNWGANDPVVESSTPSWGQSDPEVHPDLARRHEEQAQMTAYARKQLEGAKNSIPLSFLGPLGVSNADRLATAVGLGTSIAAPLARSLGTSGAPIGSKVLANSLGSSSGEDLADKLNRFGDAYEQAASERDQQGVVPSTLKRAVRGAGKTLPTTIVSGRALGSYGSIATTALQERDQAITEARDMGLPEDKVQHYANTQGLIEGAVEAAFQRVGLGGLQSAVTRETASKSLRPAIKQFAKDLVLGELPSEIVTETGHSGARREQLTGKPFSWNDLLHTWADTAVQTFVTMGAAEAPDIAQSVPSGQARAQRLTQLKALRSVNGADLKREAAKLGIEGTRSDIRGQVNLEIKQTEKEIQNEVPPEAVPAPEAPQVEVPPVGGTTGGPQGNQQAGAEGGSQVQVDPHQAMMEALDAMYKAAPEATPATVQAKPQEEVIAQGPTDITIPSEKPEAPVVEPEHISYHSGLSRSPAEVDEAIKSGTPVGVSAFSGLSAPMRKKLVDYANSGGKVFVDSGAFTAFTKGKEVDWDKTLFAYHELIQSTEEGKRSNISIVAPDVVGNHSATIKLQQELRDKFQPFLEGGAKVIVPVQQGGHETLAANFADLTDTFDMEGVTLGVPFNAKAWTQDAVLDLMRFRDKADPGRPFHLLGAGPEKVAKLFDAAKAEGLSTDGVSADALPKKISYRKKAQKPPESLPAAPKPIPAPEPTQPVPVTPVASQEAEKPKNKGLKEKPAEPAAIPAELGAVYQTTVGGKKKFAVREFIDNPRGGGDSLFDTQEQAQQEAERLKNRQVERAASKQAEADKEAAAQKAKAEAADINGFGDNLPAMQRQKVINVLNEQVTHRGKVTSRKEIVRQRVKDGYTVQTTKDGERRLMGPDGESFLSVKDITKTAMDYAEHLSPAKPASPEPIPPVEEKKAAEAGHWLNSLDETTRENVFGRMRELQSKADFHEGQRKKLTPKQGTIGVGSADMDEFFKAEAYSNFLGGLRRGMDPQAAADHAKQEARAAIAKWNERGTKGRMKAGNPRELDRWEGHSDTTIDNAMRSVMQASKPTKPVQDEPWAHERTTRPEEESFLDMESTRLEKESEAATKEYNKAFAEWNNASKQYGPTADKRKAKYEKLRPIADEKREAYEKSRDRWLKARMENYADQTDNRLLMLAARQNIRDTSPGKTSEERHNANVIHDRTREAIVAEIRKLLPQAHALENDFQDLPQDQRDSADELAVQQFATEVIQTPGQAVDPIDRLRGRLRGERLGVARRLAHQEINALDMKGDGAIFTRKLDTSYGAEEVRSVVEQAKARKVKYDEEQQIIKQRAEADKKSRSAEITAFNESILPPDLSATKSSVAKALPDQISAADPGILTDGRVLAIKEALPPRVVKEMSERKPSKTQRSQPVSKEATDSIVKGAKTGLGEPLKLLGIEPEKTRTNRKGKKERDPPMAIFEDEEGKLVYADAEKLAYLHQAEAYDTVRSNGQSIMLFKGKTPVAVVMPMESDYTDKNLDVAALKQRFPEAAPKIKGKKPKTALQQSADKALDEAIQELKDFGKLARGTNIGVHPEALAVAAKVVYRFAKAGTLQFAAMIEKLVASIGQAQVDTALPALEAEWDKAYASGEHSGMEPRELPTPVQQEQAVEKSQTIDPEDLTSIKKEVVNQMREERGVPEREGPVPETVEQWAEEARITLANDPMAAIRLVNQIGADPAKPLSEREVTLLQFQYRKLQNERNAFRQEYFDAVAAEDSARIVTAKTDLVNSSSRMTQFEDAIRPAGTASGRSLAAFKTMLREDFSLGAILRKGREANAGKELNEKQTAELTAMSEKLEEVQGKLDAETKRREAAEAELAAQRQHEQVVKEVKSENVRKKTDRRQKAEKRVESAWAAFHRATSGSTPNSLLGFNLAPQVIELAQAYVDLGVVRLGEFLAAAKARLGDKLDEDQFRAAWEKVAPEAPSLAELDSAELSIEARRLQRMLVQEGMTDRDQVTQAVHQILKAELPDLTMRQTMDALSRYGIFQVPSKNEVDKILRGMRSELLKLSQIDQQEIALKRVEELRAEGKTDEEIGNALQDENLLVAATGLVRDKPTETLRKLTELYNANKASIPSTSQQKEGKLSTARNAYETRLKNQIKAYEEILEKGDFAPKPKKPVRTLSDAELKLKRQYDDTRSKVLQKFAEYELAHMSPGARVWDTIKEVSHLQRALATGFDISPFGRQGGPVAYSHPLLAANVLKEVVTELYRQTNTADIGTDFSWEHLGQFLTGLDSRQAEFNVLHDLNDNEQGRFRLEAGLSMTSSEEQATKQEEFMSGRFAKHIPGIAISGRIGVMIQNKMRAMLFDLMVDNIGRTGQVSLDEGKLIAQFVNMATGRVDWGPKMNQRLSDLNILFFSSRWVASRFEYLANPLILPFRGGGLKKNWRVKRAIYMEYGRTFGSVSTVLGIVALAGALFWDDDDEDKPRVELDPRSPDFLKIRMGETRLDLMFGLSQVMVLSAQFRTHQKKSSITGEVRDIGEGHRPQTRADLISHFARSKLAPIPGAVWTVGDDMENVVGQKETPGSLARSLLLPISLADAGKSMQDRGIPLGATLDVLSTMGAGLNTYGPKTNFVYGTKEQREKQIQDDLRYMAWNDPVRPPYSEFLTDDQLEKFAQRREEKRALVIFNATYNGKNEDELKTRDKNLEHLKEMKAEGVTLEDARALLKAHYLKPDSQGKRGSLSEGYYEKQRALTRLFAQ